MNGILLTARRRGFKTLRGLLFFLAGTVLLGMGGFNFRHNDKRDKLDYIFGGVGAVCIVLSFIFEAKGTW